MKRFFTKKSVASFFLFLGVFSFFYLTPTNVAHADFGWGILAGAFTWGISNFVLLVINIIGGIMQLLFTMSAFLLDMSIRFSIFNFKNLVDSSTALNGIWILFRDIVNIGFIFVLLYIAIKQILSSTGASEKKLIGALIIDAVFVNFSMFIFKLIIDFGNIIATAIYNQINGGGGIASIITANLGLGDFLNTFNFDLNIVNQGNTIVVMILKVVLMGIALYVFVWAAIIFIGRAVMLLYLIVTSPIAFSGNALPAMKSYQQQHWKDLWNQVFLAPVFLLFMLIISRILSAAALAGAIKSSSVNAVLDISGYFYYIIGIYFLIIALNKTKEMSGQVADLATKIASGVSGAILAVFTGGGATVLQQTLGRYGASVASRKDLQDKASDKDASFASRNFARLKLFGADKVARSSFDVRESGAGQFGAKFLKDGGIDLGDATSGKKALGGLAGLASFGLNKTEGGFVQAKKDFADQKAKFTETYLSRPDLKQEEAIKEQIISKNKSKSEKEKDLEQERLLRTPDQGKIDRLEREIKKLGQEVTDLNASTEKSVAVLEDIIKTNRDEIRSKRVEFKDPNTTNETKRKQLTDEIKILEDENAERLADLKRYSEVSNKALTERKNFYKVQFADAVEKEALWVQDMTNTALARFAGKNKEEISNLKKQLAQTKVTMEKQLATGVTDISQNKAIQKSLEDEIKKLEDDDRKDFGSAQNFGKAASGKIKKASGYVSDENQRLANAIAAAQAANK